jgi:tetratricopeptide (TPR) repeat protein
LFFEEVEKNCWVLDSSDIPFEYHEQVDLAIDHMNSGSFKIAERTLLRVLEVCPDHIDAWHHLSLIKNNQGKFIEAFNCANTAVSICLHLFPDDFSWKKSTILYAHFENRPFMRAYHNLGLLYLEACQTNIAMKIFRRLVSVNENDNQGCRYLLSYCFLLEEDYLSIIDLCKKYPDDYSSEFLFNLPLALFKLKKSKQAKNALTAAIEAKPLVAKELLKKRHPKPKNTIPGYIARDSHEEAYEYWQRHYPFWKGTPLELLREMC